MKKKPVWLYLKLSFDDGTALQCTTKLDKVGQEYQLTYPVFRAMVDEMVEQMYRKLESENV